VNRLDRSMTARRQLYVIVRLETIIYMYLSGCVMSSSFSFDSGHNRLRYPLSGLLDVWLAGVLWMCVRE